MSNPEEEQRPVNLPSVVNDAPLFGSRTTQSTPLPVAAWLVSALVVVLLLVGALVVSRHNAAKPAPNAVLPLAPDAATLSISGVAMSESTSISGGKSTYIDGVIRNNGKATVTGVTVQVLFANDEALPPQIETLPLSLIRTRQPYVDIEPVSAEPLKPGEEHAFRLIFESVAANWNQQVPEIHVVAIETK